MACHYESTAKKSGLTKSPGSTDAIVMQMMIYYVPVMLIWKSMYASAKGGNVHPPQLWKQTQVKLQRQQWGRGTVGSCESPPCHGHRDSCLVHPLQLPPLPKACPPVHCSHAGAWPPTNAGFGDTTSPIFPAPRVRREPPSTLRFYLHIPQDPHFCKAPTRPREDKEGLPHVVTDSRTNWPF